MVYQVYCHRPGVVFLTASLAAGCRSANPELQAELPEETPLTPPGRGGWGGCSSYQRLSKFAGSFPDPILNPGLRGNRKKTCQGWICEKKVKKGSKNRCF